MQHNQIQRSSPRIAFLARAMNAVRAELAKAADNVALAMHLKSLGEMFRRVHRQEARWGRRERLHTVFHSIGLNGGRAVERRKRQISAGQLRVENGLVAAA